MEVRKCRQSSIRREDPLMRQEDGRRKKDNDEILRNDALPGLCGGR